MHIRKLVRIFVPLLILLFTFIHAVNAHPYSVSYTTLTFSAEETTLEFSIDTLSVMELLQFEEQIEVQNGEFLSLHEEKLEDMIARHLILLADHEPQRARLDDLGFEEKNGKQFVSFTFRLPSFHPGTTIQFIDDFYKNDPNTNYINLLSVSDRGIWSEAIFQGSNREWIYLLSENQTEQVEERISPSEQPSSTWFDFFLLGMEHILTGYDHLLFLFVLLLRKQTFTQYVTIITSFTIAHSITIALTALGLINFPSRIVETVIALSICYVALENIFRTHIRHRWAVTFLFGLIHGMGFASILKEMATSTERLLIPLISFNVGIEVIQLTLVTILLPILIWMQKLKISRSIVVTGSSAIALIGGLWLMERLWL